MVWAVVWAEFWASVSAGSQYLHTSKLSDMIFFTCVLFLWRLISNWVGVMTIQNSRTLRLPEPVAWAKTFSPSVEKRMFLGVVPAKTSGWVLPRWRMAGCFSAHSWMKAMNCWVVIFVTSPPTPLRLRGEIVVFISLGY